MGYRVGIDVGGTFTDFLLMLEDGTPEVYKTSSTPKDPTVGVVAGLTEMAAAHGLTLEEFVKQVELIVHGTTVTTNAVLTNNGVKTGLLTTEGFRDILEMRRGWREELYDNKLTPPTPMVSRDRRMPVTERVDYQGNVVTPLDQQSVRDAIAKLREQQVDAVAVCFMHAYANPEHEKQAKAILEAEMPDVFLTISAELLPQVRFYERLSTAVLNSYVGPILKRYLQSLTRSLKEIGFGGVLLIMQSNGGVATPEATVDRPAMTLLSGPAAGPVAGIAFASVQGYNDCITVDMGGTSFDAALVRDRTPLLTSEGWINRQRLALPMLDIHTIGAGGGSVGWIDEGGLLRMGPQSAGAQPGPACYGRGGELPTCTDANVVLGYLSPDYFLGGRMPLYEQAAHQAIETHIAKPLGMTVEEAAAGMYQVINVNMASGIREISVKRGLDPRDYPLVVAGGAGPIHAAPIALELEIPVILVPRESSIFCAGGMLRSDLKHDFVRTHHSLLGRADGPYMLQLFREMAHEGEAVLRDEGVSTDRIRYAYAVDMRYLGQHNEITVEISLHSAEHFDSQHLAKLFHQAHERLYGYSLEEMGTELEVLNLRVVTTGITVKPDTRREEFRGEDASAHIKGERAIYLPRERGFRTVPVHNGDAMGYGNRVEGPAIIEQITTTIVVPTEYNVVVDAAGTFALYLKEIEDSYLRRALA